jgi:hypothetical protein
VRGKNDETNYWVGPLRHASLRLGRSPLRSNTRSGGWLTWAERTSNRRCLLSEYQRFQSNTVLPPCADISRSVEYLSSAPAAAPQRNERKRTTNKTIIVFFYPYRPLFTAVHCLFPEPFTWPLVHRIWQLAPFSHYANQTILMPRVHRDRLSVKHPRPHALCVHRLSGPSARELAAPATGERSIGETPLVCEPLAGETAGCFCCRSWAHAVYTGGKMGR